MIMFSDVLMSLKMSCIGRLVQVLKPGLWHKSRPDDTVALFKNSPILLIMGFFLVHSTKWVKQSQQLYIRCKASVFEAVISNVWVTTILCLFLSPLVTYLMPCFQSPTLQEKQLFSKVCISVPLHSFCRMHRNWKHKRHKKNRWSIAVS